MTKARQIEIYKKYIDNLIDMYLQCESESYSDAYLDSITFELREMKKIISDVTFEETFFDQFVENGAAVKENKEQEDNKG